LSTTEGPNHDKERTVTVAALRPGPWFAEVRSLVLSSLPQAEDVVIAGADHSLATAHPAEIAAALVPFLRRHPVKGQAPRTRR